MWFHPFSISLWNNSCRHITSLFKWHFFQHSFWWNFKRNPTKKKLERERGSDRSAALRCEVICSVSLTALTTRYAPTLFSSHPRSHAGSVLYCYYNRAQVMWMEWIHVMRDLPSIGPTHIKLDWSWPVGFLNISDTNWKRTRVIYVVSNYLNKKKYWFRGSFLFFMDGEVKRG